VTTSLPFNLRAWLAMRAQKRRRRSWPPPPPSLPPVPVITKVTPIYGGTQAGQVDLQVDCTVEPYAPGDIVVFVLRADDPANEYTVWASLPSEVTEFRMSRVCEIPAPGVAVVYRVKLRFVRETEQSDYSTPFEVTLQSP
jgi:hypothetical protein